MIRKVGISLKYKFVFVITLLLLMTMFFYLSYALKIFKEDKSADIYSMSLGNSSAIAERVRLILNEEAKIFDTLENIPLSTISDETIFLNHDEIYGIECSQTGGVYSAKVNSKKLSSEGINFELSANNSSLDKNKISRDILLGTSKVSGLPNHFVLFKELKNESKCGIYFSFEKLMGLSKDANLYGAYVISDSGQIFLKLSDQKVPTDLLKIINDSTILKNREGVKRFVENEGAIMRAFSKISPFNLIAITEISEKKAFMASEILIERSILFGILILSIAVIAGIIFTKRMTRNIQTLFDATVQLSKGDFNISPQVSGNDEVGALSDSFVYMKDKILQYMEEMKEKARIENEVQIAKLVQDSFFPKTGIENYLFDCHGHFESASECSGDWWGYFSQENKVTIIVCDATGHGVGAALITSAAHSCLTTIKMEAEKEYISPAQVLMKLNKVISALNTNIFMTAFALEVDLIKKTIKYSNASHMVPFLLRKSAAERGEYSKEDLIVLNENNGPRIGERQTKRFDETEISVLENDKIILFSDGIIDATNGEKAYGQRAFLKNIFKNANSNSDSMVKKIIGEVKEYIGKHAFLDDVTLICLSFKSDVCLINSSDDLIKLQNLPHQSSLVFSHLSNFENVNDILKHKNIMHLIGMNGLNQSYELEIMKKFRKTDDLTKVFSDHSYASKIDLKSNSEINETIQNEIARLKENQQTANFVSMKEETIRFISNELLSNAFYHRENKNVVRGEEITLVDDQSIQYEILNNDYYLILSVTGPSRIPSREQLLKVLKRAYTEKTPAQKSSGAGLGLYLCFDRSAQFWVVNNKVICILEKFNRNKNFEERITSFHYLNEDSHE